jgi:hypothetical protein
MAEKWMVPVWWFKSPEIVAENASTVIATTVMTVEIGTNAAEALRKKMCATIARKRGIGKWFN